MFEHIFRMLLSLIVTAIVARYLGTGNYGLLNYGMAFITIFLTLSSLGIESILVYEIVSDDNNTGKLLGTAITMRFLSSTLSVIMIFIIILITDYGNRILIAITIIQSLSIIFHSFDFLKFWFQSRLNSKYVVISKLIAFLCVSVWRLLLVFMGKNVTWFAVSTVIESLVTSIVVILIYWKLSGPKLIVNCNYILPILKKSYIFIIAGILVSIYTQIDKIMLGKLTTMSEVGLYTAGMSLSNLWVFIPMAVIDSLRPIVMKEKKNSEARYIYYFGKLNAIIIWISIFAAIFISITSEIIIKIVYGDAFAGANIILIILVWSRIFSLVGVTRTIWLISENVQKYVNVFVGIGAVINVMINFFLIPKFGAYGAAIATLIAEIFSSFFILFFIKDTKELAILILKSFVNPMSYLK